MYIILAAEKIKTNKIHDPIVVSIKQNISQKYVYRYRYVRYTLYLCIFCFVFCSTLTLPVLAITIIIIKPLHQVAGEKCLTTNSKNAGNNTKNSLTNDSHDVWGIFIVFIFHFKNIHKHTHLITSHNISFTIVFYLLYRRNYIIHGNWNNYGNMFNQIPYTLNSDKFLNVILSKLNEVKNSSEENIKRHSSIHFIFMSLRQNSLMFNTSLFIFCMYFTQIY